MNNKSERSASFKAGIIKPHRDPDDGEFKRAISFVEKYYGNQSAYQNHKESMAYAGILLQFAFVSAIFSAKSWPPLWISNIFLSAKQIAFLGVVFLWSMIHIYVRWQLRRRRLALIRMNACKKVLSSWIQRPFNRSSYLPYNLSKISDDSPSKTLICMIKIKICLYLDLFVPISGIDIDTGDPIDDFPLDLAEQYLKYRRQTKGPVIMHERILFFASCIFLLLILARTFF